MLPHEIQKVLPLFGDRCPVLAYGLRFWNVLLHLETELDERLEGAAVRFELLIVGILVSSGEIRRRRVPARQG